MLSLCMIVKDEGRLMSGCLADLRDFVDEIIVVDNGSSDDTAVVARQFGCTVLDGGAFEFDQARNLYLANASQPWILVVDADERMTGRVAESLVAHLRTVDAGVAGMMLPTIQYTGSGRWSHIPQLRLFRNDDRIRYTNNGIHDTVWYGVEEVGELTPGPYTPIHHLDGLIPGRSADKRERNLAALRRVLASGEFGKNNPESRIHSFVGQEYLAMGEYELAISSLRHALALDSSIAEVDSRAYLAQAYLKLGRLDEAATEASLVPLRHSGPCLQPPSILAEIAWREDRVADALDICEQALASDPHLVHMHLNSAALIRSLSDELLRPRALTHLGDALRMNPCLVNPFIYRDGDPGRLFGPQDVVLSGVLDFPVEVALALEQAGDPELGLRWRDAWKQALSGETAALSRTVADTFEDVEFEGGEMRWGEECDT